MNDKIKEHDIFHGGIYFVPDDDERSSFADNYGGFVHFTAFAGNPAECNFEPLEEGCWGGFDYQSVEDFREYSPIVGARIEWASTQDFITAAGFHTVEEGGNVYAQLDAGAEHIQVRGAKEPNTYVARFWREDNFFDPTYDETHPITFLHELQRLMIHYGHGERAINMWTDYKDMWMD